MAEIRVERKEGKGWLWVVLALLVLALLVWWFFGRRNDSTAVGASDSTRVPAAVTADRAAVDGFLSWVGNIDTTNSAAASDLSHEYTATGIRQLAGAIASIARGDSLGGSEVNKQVSALNMLADRLQTEPQSLKHADLANAAFGSAAQLLLNVQQRSFPNASAQVGSVRQAASAISKERPLLEQRAEVNRFFSDAADAVRAMRGGA
ncbi:hypothetical protein [Gemmatimonas sp.]|uniref:hypothetical protein n=1 Tax=Gemmatimonas sp. TaxID=1962908 RepID=UPI0039831BD4